MDRAQPGARGSTNRNIEFGETTGQYSDGWIVPSDEPTLSAQRYTSLDETAFNEFDAAYTADSLTVTIAPGEGFVDGWIARDTTTDLTLAPNTDDQQVVLGWDPDAVYDETRHSNRNAADRVIIDLEYEITDMTPRLSIWSFDTNEQGVISATDQRTIGPSAELAQLRGTEILYFGDSDEWSLRYGTGKFIIRDESNGEDLISIDDSGDAIEFARSLGTLNDPIPGKTHLEGVGVKNLQPETVGNDYHYTAAYDGDSPDIRLDNTLNAADTADTIYLENATYNSDRTISIQALSIIGSSSSISGTRVLDGTWTLDSNEINITNLRLDNSELIHNGGFGKLENITAGTVTINANRVRYIGGQDSDVHFSSGTIDGIVDSSVTVTVTDNGNNSVGNIT